MNTQTYTNLLANPASINAEALGELEVIIEKYPYFQSARALQLKGLKNENSFLYNDALKVTAAYTTDRDILFEYITSESFVQNEISELILQHSERVREMEVVSEDVSEMVSLELEQQLKAEMEKAEAILDPHLFERKLVVPVDISEIKREEEITEINSEAEVVSAPETEEPAIPMEKKLEPSISNEEETKLKIDAPLPFTKDDTHTFGEWLKLTSATPIQRKKEVESSQAPSEEIPVDEKSKKFELIEKFIQQKPKLDPKPAENKNVNLAKPYTKASDTLMTETLAKVYLQQKNYKKAIQAYKILILKNPEKSGFFADQIRAIQKLIKETK